MKLISLTADKPSFHPVIFKDGINIIVGKQVTPHSENNGNTYNGVGKSLIIHLIHFCLGSNKIKALETNLPDWTFTLKFKIEDETYTASRNTIEQNKIIFCGEKLSLTETKKKLLELCFKTNDLPKNMTWNTLFSRFARRYRSCYSSFDSFVPQETDYIKLLNNCYLLGIDTELIVNKKDLRDQQTQAKETENTIKKDPILKQYYVGNNDADLDVIDLEYRIKNLEEEISSFKISKNYHELGKEADDKSYQKKQLENERVLINNNIKNIENAIEETADIKEDKIINIYKEAKIEIPQMIKKNIDDVLKFHSELLKTRNIRLEKELAKNKKKLLDIDEEIEKLGKRMDELLSFLDTHGALEEYLALTKELANLKNELNKVHEYQTLLKTYHESQMNISSRLIAEDRRTNEYLEVKQEDLRHIQEKFCNYTKEFYPSKKSGLIIRNNSGENTLRYYVDARIEDDSSDGVNEVRIFCFNMLFLECQQSKIKFIIHDSRLFANMDPRQRATLFRIVDRTCHDKDFQYICSINEDAIKSIEPIISDEEYQKVVRDNIILELNDDAPESKLLGIQIDINLENNNKSSSEII